MVSNQFFVKKGPYPLKEIIKAIDCTNNYSNVKDFEIHGVESLVNAKENDMTFLNSSKYKNLSLKTKAALVSLHLIFQNFFLIIASNLMLKILYLL